VFFRRPLDVNLQPQVGVLRKILQALKVLSLPRCERTVPVCSEKYILLLAELFQWRVDIELPPVGILCILCYLPLSMREVPHYSAVGDISLPLTEPDLQISHIRLFSYPHFAGDKV
jgi:hypothetical protein